MAHSKRKYGKKKSIRNKAHKVRNYTDAGPVTVTPPGGEPYELPAYGLVDLARVRAGARVTAGKVTADQRAKIYARDGGRCRYCAELVGPDAAPYEIDHVVPRAKGGATTEANLVLACRSCNRTKGDEVWTPNA